MKGKYIQYLLLCLFPLALFSCVKETPEDPAVGPANTILYSAMVSHSPLTRVAISDGSDEPGFTAGCRYVFEEGDKLYVEHRDGETLKLYGVLDIVSGVGTGSARFEGELKCLDDFVPEDNTLLSATVVGAGAADDFFQFGNPTDDPSVDPGAILTAVNFPASIPNTTVQEMVRKYSCFTGTSTYDAKNFNNLTQQSVFLLISLEVNRTKLSKQLSEQMITTVSIKKSDDSEPVVSVTGVPVDGLSAVGSIQCTAVVPVSKNPDMQSAGIWAGALKCGESLAADLSLAVNHYYSVRRSSLATDWFRIKATQNGTTVTCNYYSAEDGIKYSLDGGVTWTDYLTKEGILLKNKGDEVCFQGSRTNYRNALADGNPTYGRPSDTPIFEADKKCYIAGNVMTLLKDQTLSDEAFNGAFSKDKDNTNNSKNTWTDIDPSDPLLLPATTLTRRCYKGMFRKCTALQYAPDLPVETPAAECYSGMFRDCGNSNLQRVRIFLKAKKGPGVTKDDFDFAKLGEGGYLDKWMQGTSPSTGAIYCHPDMEAYWVNVWSWYGSSNQFANRPKNWSVIPWTSYQAL